MRFYSKVDDACRFNFEPGNNIYIDTHFPFIPTTTSTTQISMYYFMKNISVIVDGLLSIQYALYQFQHFRM